MSVVPRAMMLLATSMFGFGRFRMKVKCADCGQEIGSSPFRYRCEECIEAAKRRSKERDIEKACDAAWELNGER